MTAICDAKQGAVCDLDGIQIRALEDLPPLEYPPQGRGRCRRARGLLSLDEACARYTLSVEEFLSWQRLIDRHGLGGLRVTRLQDYREK